ncbi:MAG: DegT/DnrJ/EryC1/StrS family aminotransferase [Candidatus Rokubacteria bacterium]|nr:DegT/DnrJ/EryC1/StrS family aminotransferase [Candidatus Rokubacteria bacterium]
MSAGPPILQKDPRASYLAHRAEIDAAIRGVLEGGRYILGEQVAAFERELAAFVGVAEGVGVASGTDALELSLRALGIGAGDAVFTVSHTAVATAAAIERSGAVPVLVDIDEATLTMDPQSLEDAVKKVAGDRAVARPRAVVPVHLYGHPADMPAILDVARRHDLRVVEDCAQSHGARLDGRATGGWGDTAAFSFYPTKNLGAVGDGGMLLTADPTVAGRARALREYGWRERYVSDVPGLNSRLDELQAAILRVKLRHLEADNARLRALAGAYDRALADAPVQRPARRPGVEHAYHQYVVRTPQRDGLQRWLRDRGIGTAVHYPQPVHRQPAYAGRTPLVVSLPRTETAVREILSLPLYPELAEAAVARVAEAVRSWTPDGG